MAQLGHSVVPLVASGRAVEVDAQLLGLGLVWQAPARLRARISKFTHSFYAVSAPAERYARALTHTIEHYDTSTVQAVLQVVIGLVNVVQWIFANGETINIQLAREIEIDQRAEGFVRAS